jgi:hypothetical protein
MGVRILIGSEQGDAGVREQAVLFDSVTGWAFGPLFREDESDGTNAEDMAELFLKWVEEHEGRDVRTIVGGELRDLYAEWLDTRH